MTKNNKNNQLDSYADFDEIFVFFKSLGGIFFFSGDLNFLKSNLGVSTLIGFWPKTPKCSSLIGVDLLKHLHIFGTAKVVTSKRHLTFKELTRSLPQQQIHYYK